jgi:hypothetical protein
MNKFNEIEEIGTSATILTPTWLQILFFRRLFTLMKKINCRDRPNKIKEATKIDHACIHSILFYIQNLTLENQL